MKIIKESTHIPPAMVKQITCRQCYAVLEITPEDCRLGILQKEFGITCPCCNEQSFYMKSDVDTLFWNRIV